MKQKIDALVFDLGGVLYDVDIELSVKAFAQLGLKNFDQLYTLKEQVPLFDELETGRINEDQFVDALSAYFDVLPPQKALTDAWCALLIGMRPENVGLLKELSENYKIYLLSNTNIIHLNRIDNEMRSCGIKHLADLFHKAYFSFELGLRKPSAEIFDHVIQDSGIKPEKTLYLEDSEANAEAGEKTGFQVYLSKRNRRLRKIIEELKLL